MSLVISPSLVTLTPAGTQTFTASGGSGSGYVFSFLANNSGGTLNSSTGAYVAGFGGVMDVILLTDSLENSTSATVTVIGLSEFQGIGLLPQLASVPAPTMGDAGDFLSTDGSAIFWASITADVLPDQTGHGGDFLTTDGATASWAAVSGGLLPTFTPGFLTNDGAVASWTYTSPFDIRNFGAVSAVTATNPSDAVVDCTAAFYSSWAIVNNVNPLGTNRNSLAEVPVGNFYVSAPLLMPYNSGLIGQGRFLSNILVGPGDSTTPSLVQGFSGPVVYGTGAATANVFPDYTSPVVGSSGQAMEYGPPGNLSGFAFNPVSLVLHHSYAWFTWLVQGNVSAWTLQGWYKPTVLPAFPANIYITPIITSKGPEAYEGFAGTLVGFDQAFGLYITNNNGGTQQFKAILTTTGSGQQIIFSSVVVINTAYNIELVYDGAHFDFFLNGVSQGPVAMTGTILMRPWEGVTIGIDGPEYQTFGAISGQGVIDSIRLSNVARHTPGGSFTPPTTKYAWDSNTMALVNFDQTFVQTGQPFVGAQAVLPRSVVPAPHYLTMGAVSNPNANLLVQGIGVDCNQTTSGVVFRAASRSTPVDVIVYNAANQAIGLPDADSFYSQFTNCFTYSAAGTGMLWFGNGIGGNSIGCGISIQALSGYIQNWNDQPGGNSYIPFVAGPADPNYSFVVFQNCNNDEEGQFTQLCALYIFGAQLAQFTSINSAWDVEFQTVGIPPVIYAGIPTDFAKHIGDTIYADANSPCFIMQEVPFAGQVLCIGTDYQILNVGSVFKNPGIVPFSNAAGFVTNVTPEGSTNQRGISTTDTPANNLAGTFTILHGFTSGGPTFTVPEVDGRYVVDINYMGFNGASPATGSTTPGPYTTGPTGFVMAQGTDPASTSETIWSWTLTRTVGAPLYSSYLPTVPSNFANPLAGTTGDWAVGITLTPTSGNVINFNWNTAAQIAIEAGGTFPSSNWWSINLDQQQRYNPQLGTSGAGFLIDSFVNNGKLYGLANPGAHNIVMSVIGFEGATYVDGGFRTLGVPATITQPATIYVGERFDSTLALTVAGIRRIEIDTTVAQVIKHEQDAGPQSGQTLAAFLGDQQTIGWSSTTNGGFASQIANIRYPTTYYYLAGYSSPVAFVTDQQAGFQGILSMYWTGWANQQTFGALCVLGGFNDLLAGVSATDCFTALNGIMNGVAATATFIPPIHVATYPTVDYTAWCVLFPPNSNLAGTTTFTINGHTINMPFTTDEQTTVTNMANAINAIGGLSAIVTASPLLFTGQNVWYTLIQANVTGAAGNGILTITTNGLNGAYCYPADISLPVPNFGLDVTCIIDGISIVANFDTDASTTVNNLIARIVANGTLNALVSCANVAGRLVITDKTTGAAGNSILVNTNTAGNAVWITGPHMVDGANGAIQNAIPNIVLCTVPPFGQAPGFTSGKDTQRNSLNTTIRAFTGAGVTIADVDILLRDPANHVNMLAAYLGGDSTNPSTAGHNALYTLLAPLLPGGSGTPTSALTYGVNPATYASTVLITPNIPSVTGTPTQYVVSPALPTGLSISASTGHITGTPTTPTAMATYTVMASNASGSTTVGLVITIT